MARGLMPWFSLSGSLMLLVSLFLDPFSLFLPLTPCPSLSLCPPFCSLSPVLPSPEVSGATVELLYDAKAEIGEGPFFEPETNQLLWADIAGHSINFLDLEKKENR